MANTLSRAPSLWADTARPPINPTPLLEDVNGDIAIIGAGYTGLSAALRAIELGLKPVVIEANEIGWGASGRNGGSVTTRYRASLRSIAQSHGIDVARQMYALGVEAFECVERYVSELTIADAEFKKNGKVHCAHNQTALARIIAESDFMRETLGETGARVLSAAEVEDETGSSSFVGGILSNKGATLHPLNYARGLANAVRSKGAQIYEQSPVIAQHREGGCVRLSTARGTVTAKRVLIATNAYSDLSGATKSVRTAVIPFRSAIIATQPLPASTLSTLLRHDRSYSETRRMMRWFRLAGNQMLVGGRGAFGVEKSESAHSALENALRTIFPQLAGVGISHRWSGLVAMTMDSLPQIGMLNSNVGFALGYNGAGIAMASLLGRHAIDVAGGSNPELSLMQRKRVETIPFFFLRKPAVRAVAGWYQLQDRIGR